MTKEELIDKFKENDYDWNAQGNDFCVKQHLKAVEEYVKKNNPYTKKQMKTYAEHCMIKLLTNYPNGEDEMGEISPVDLHRIKQILNKNKDEQHQG